MPLLILHNFNIYHFHSLYCGLLSPKILLSRFCSTPHLSHSLHDYILHLLITNNLNPSLIFNSCNPLCHLSFLLILPTILTQSFTVTRTSSLWTALCPLDFLSSYLLYIHYLVINHYIHSLSYALYSLAPFLLLHTRLAKHQL